jgi:hypothetical protein
MIHTLCETRPLLDILSDYERIHDWLWPRNLFFLGFATFGPVSSVGASQSDFDIRMAFQRKCFISRGPGWDT